MKKIVALMIALALFSSCEDENEGLNKVTYEEALAAQYIGFEIEDRKIYLTEFKKDAWPFHGAIVMTDSIDFDSNLQYPVSRTVYASVPEDQVLRSNIETFGLEFNQIFKRTDISMEGNKVLSNENFRSEFLRVGEQNVNLSNFGFHQTYLIGAGQSNKSYFMVTQIEGIVEHDNLILVTGEFSGALDNYFFEELTNGEFKVLIEN